MTSQGDEPSASRDPLPPGVDGESLVEETNQRLADLLARPGVNKDLISRFLGHEGEDEDLQDHDYVGRCDRNIQDGSVIHPITDRSWTRGVVPSLKRVPRSVHV